MISTFYATLNPMLTLFICIAIGFIVHKTKILPENAASVMAKLETWVFCPALSFSTMSRNCTPDTISSHAINIMFGVVCVSLAMLISTRISPLFVRSKGMERGIYTYALAFANSGYVGDPLVLAMFGSKALSYYKLFCLPILIMIYTWGISSLVPASAKGNPLKKLLNPSTIALFCGIVFGLTGLGAHMPAPVVSSLDSLKGCMAPVAMILAGFTIAGYDMKKMLSNKKVYVATALRLTVLPTVILTCLFGLRALLNAAFGMQISNAPLFLAFFATAAPLGLNTVVFPEAYGGDPKTGAAMTMISHTLCVVTIPLMYMLASTVFGPAALPLG